MLLSGLGFLKIVYRHQQDGIILLTFLTSYTWLFISLLPVGWCLKAKVKSENILVPMKVKQQNFNRIKEQRDSRCKQKTFI